MEWAVWSLLLASGYLKVVSYETYEEIGDDLREADYELALTNLKDLIARADRETKGQIGSLLRGGTLDIQVHEEVTYEDMHSSGENLWNFLYIYGISDEKERIF